MTVLRQKFRSDKDNYLHEELVSQVNKVTCRTASGKMKMAALQVQSTTLGTLAHFRHFRHFKAWEVPKVIESANAGDCFSIVSDKLVRVNIDWEDVHNEYS
jgi:hypothetical protein